MSGSIPFANIELSVDSASRVAIEVWRLKRWAEQSSDVETNPVLKRTLRTTYELLRLLNLEVVDFTGQVYDAGMAPEVVDVQFSDGTVDDTTIVIETITPTVTWKGQLIVGGQIIVRRPQMAPGTEKAE